MANFTGQLNPNEIFAALFNMIISQQVFASPIKGTYSALMEANRTEGSLYGDTKLYYSTDVLESVPWGNDAEATNLLALHRPPAPSCQAITLDNFRQISLTVDNYLTKRAWSTEGAFSDFNGVMLAWIRDTKRVYDATLFNSYVGTAETTVGNQSITIEYPTQTGDTEASNRLQAQAIAEGLANLLVELADVSRDYNDYGYLRSYSDSELTVVWNSEWLNKIKKIDLPTMFHKEDLLDKFGGDVLPARYFGTVNTTAGTTASTNTTVRSLVETDYGTTHVFPGDLLPASTSYTANTTYTTDSSIVFKVMKKDGGVPFMSAFEVGTSFFNAKSLTENQYLTWGYNTLEYLKEYPFVTVRAEAE